MANADLIRLSIRQNPAPTADDSNPGSGGNTFVNLISNPFSSELNATSFYASLAWTLILSAVLGAGFCLLRPRTNAVYAPRAKHADAKHAPPRIDNGLFSWIKPIRNVREHELVEKIGMDAVVFLRFTRMLRNIFIVLTIFGCGIIIPVNLTGKMAGGPPSSNSGSTGSGSSSSHGITPFMRFTPQYGTGSKFWAYTFCAYLFDAVVCFFIWWNYGKIVQLRRKYLQSPDYLSSLHSRTLMITQVPAEKRTDEGLLRIADEALSTDESPRTAIARNAKDLPELLEDHDKAVIALEKHLAKYLRDPNTLPAKRPTCKPFKNDKAHNSKQEVDAIDYLTGRIRELELEIKETRERIDKRDAMSYGFASYTRVENAHAVAYAARNKGPDHSTIRLAPKPNDLIWTNLAMTRRERRTKAFWNGVWMTVLTGLYIVPNVLTAVFLSDFSNLGQVWPGFQKNLEGHHIWWGIVQGIAAPLIQSLFYLILPTIFRRLFHHSGDPSKTSRERHVISRLYAFYIINQLIVFCLFASVWRFIAGAINSGNSAGTTPWDYIKNYHVFFQLVAGLCQTSPYFITAQLQKNLTAAVDLIQAWPLIQGTIKRKFGSPTPRETIELTAPQPFIYADYYNAYLYVATVGLAFSTVNPVILPITTLFLAIESWLKKYMLQYIFITKTESGGLYWRMAINRVIFAMLLCNVVMALVIGACGIYDYANAGHAQAAMLYALVPLPFLIWGFKWWISRTFDNQIRYVTTKPLSSAFDVEDPAALKDGERKKRHHDRVAVRFGNPALYKKLKTPMVSAKSQHLLKELFAGRLDNNINDHGQFGYSDVYMSSMAHDQPGKVAGGDSTAPFEVVHEHDMDFENFKKRQEFREEFGGDGELYSHGSRPTSRGSMSTMNTLMGPGGLKGRRGSDSANSSRASSRTRYDAGAVGEAGMTYPKGYHSTPGIRSDSPARGRNTSMDIAAQGHPAFRDADADSTHGLVGHGAPMGRIESRVSSPGGFDMHMGGGGHYRSGSGSRPETPGAQMDEDTSYDYFRRGSRR